MPSFYPRSSGRSQLPLTPPEYQSYSAGAPAAMAFSQAPYSAQPRSDHRASTGYYDRFQWAYPREEPSQYLPSTSTFAPDVYGKPAFILPPPVATRPPTYEQVTLNDVAYHPRVQEVYQATEQSTASAAEKPVGGVSAKLDYDMDTMTDFVAQMAHGIVLPGMRYHQSHDATWRKWVHQVLCATRLPSSTILLSLQYLTMRMQQLSRGDNSSQPNYQRQRMLTVALILGSKFLDDNTFINRSWAEVSGIEVQVLNYMELDWFQAMDHRLHRDPSESQGFDYWKMTWNSYESNINLRKASSMRLSPIDTSVQYQKSTRSSYSIPTLHSQQKSAYGSRRPAPEPIRRFDSPAYGQYDSTWLYPHSATDSSPASAPHTGPTTPEYYASAGPIPAPWSSNGGYSRRTMFGFPASQPPIPQAQSLAGVSATLTAPIQEPSLQHMQMYNGHHAGCHCFHCSYSPPKNYLQGYSNFAQPLSVAG